MVGRVQGAKASLVQQKLCWDEAALDRIHGEAGLLEHGEAQEDGIPGLSKDHAARNRFPVRCHCGVTHVPLGVPTIGEQEGNRPDSLDPEYAEDLSRNHRTRGTGIRQSSDFP